MKISLDLRVKSFYSVSLRLPSYKIENSTVLVSYLRCLALPHFTIFKNGHNFFNLMNGYTGFLGDIPCLK